MIRHWPDLVLARGADRVDDFTGVVPLVDEMWQAMEDADGVGLAANQIGRPESVFVAMDVRVGAAVDARIVVVNPVVVEATSTLEEAEEGCLSRPGEWHVMARPSRLVVDGYDEHGTPRRWDVSGFQARIFAHEIDHLAGRVIGPGTPGWREATHRNH